MITKQFDGYKNKADHGKFPEHYRSNFFIATEGNTHNFGFSVSTPMTARALINIQTPVEIRCGNSVLLNNMVVTFPHLESIIKTDDWHEDRIFLVMDRY